MFLTILYFCASSSSSYQAVMPYAVVGPNATKNTGDQIKRVRETSYGLIEGRLSRTHSLTHIDAVLVLIWECSLWVMSKIDEAQC